MRIFAIDPGTDASGVCVYDSETRVPSSPEQMPNVDLMEFVLRRSKDFDAVAIEMIGVAGIVGSTTFDTLVMIGRLMELSSVPVVRMLRKTVVAHLVGSSKGGDSDVNRAIWARYGGDAKLAKGTKRTPGPLYHFSSHSNQALGLAIAVAETVDLKRAPEEVFGKAKNIWIDSPRERRI